ncbi:MAG: GntR family transcriptional regulator [Clostridium sp.]|nr:GntR family transcriptional regulator [Clostridium sp.]
MLFDNKKLDKSVPIPLYFQLKELILNEIKMENYKEGDVIPTENEISEEFEISRTTVRQAITELVQEGWLYRVKSKGTFVTRPKIPQDFLRKLESFREQMERLGMKPSTQLIELKREKADEEVAEALNVSVGEEVIYLFRKRFADGQPIVTIHTYLPYDKCSFIMGHDLEQESLYGILGQKEDTKILKVKRRIEAVEADEEDVQLLDMEKGKPIQYFVTVGYTAADVPLEYSRARYRGDRSSFEIVVLTE